LIVYPGEGVGKMEVAHKILIRKFEVKLKKKVFLFYLMTFLQIQIQIQIVYSVQNIIHKTVDSSVSKIYYIQYNMFNNNEHSVLHMISETLISSVIQLKLDILLMKLQSYKARNSSTE
jgi:hypothetical protein